MPTHIHPDITKERIGRVFFLQMLLLLALDRVSLVSLLTHVFYPVALIKLEAAAGFSLTLLGWEIVGGAWYCWADIFSLVVGMSYFGTFVKGYETGVNE